MNLDAGQIITLALSFGAAAASYGGAMARLGRIEKENADLRQRLDNAETKHVAEIGQIFQKISDMGNRLVKIETILERLESRK